MEISFTTHQKKKLLKVFYTFLVSFIVMGAIKAQTPSSRQIARPKGSTACYFGYYEYLPSNYNSTDKLPVVIFMHGIGEAGNGTSDLSRVLRNGPPKMVQNDKDFPFILISPQHNDGWWNTLGVDLMIQHVKKTYKVDADRIYVTGLSAGGYGTWVAGQGFASQLAGIVPICGCGDSKQATNMKNLAVWAFHNSGDPTVQTSCSTVMTDAIKAAGGSPKLTIYQSNSHDAWSSTYNDQKMWDWLLAQRRYGSATPAPTPVNKAPLANAGSDISITLPTNTATITGSGSDSDGSISTYKWTKQSGGNATLADAGTSKLSLSGLVEGAYIFRLTVTDNQGSTAYDEVKVTVNPAPVPVNNAPVIAIIDDKSLTAGTTLTVTVSATDADSNPITLSVSGLPSFATFTNNNNGTGTVFVAPDVTITGTSKITISATDGNGGSDSEDFSVTVIAPPTPAPAPAPTPAPAPAPTPVEITYSTIYRVNCGGAEIKDNILNWEGDTYSSPSKYLLASGYNTEGGCWWPNRTNTTGAPNCVFGSFRSSADPKGIKYGFPVNNGNYIVNMFFAQKDNSFWAGTQKPGDHVFDVYLENNLAVDNLDIYVENGYNGVKKSVTVTVSDGILNINMLDVKGYPSVNGIEIVAVNEGTSTARVESLENPSSGAEIGVVQMYPNPVLDNQTITLEFEEPQHGKLNVAIVDQLGVTHLNKIETLERPTIKVGVDVSKVNLKSGIYFMKINSGSKKTKTLKVIKK